MAKITESKNQPKSSHSAGKKKGGKPKGRKNLTPTEIQRIMGRKLAGQSNREIARAERVNRETVSRVLSRQEYQELLAGYRSRVLGEMVPDSLELLHKAVKRGLRAKKEIPSGSLAAATTIAEGSQVLVKRQQTDMAIHQPEEFTPFGYDEYAKKSRGEKEYYLKHGDWPSQEELDYKRETGRWPSEP